MKHKTYFYRFLFLGIGLALAYGIPASLAKTTDSIFKKYVGEVETAPVGRTAAPAAHEQARYANKIPAIELEQKLIEAEKAIGFLIEEHNRRVDMISMQESYIENLPAARIKAAYADLLSQADACNAAQVSQLFGFDENGTEFVAYVPLNNLKDSDKWSEYPVLRGGAIWTQGLSRHILGTYTKELNNAKAAAGVWQGGAFDPITLDCKDWDNKEKTPRDSSKYVICKAVNGKGLLGSNNSLTKFNNLRGLLELIDNRFGTPRVPYSSAEWDDYYSNILNMTLEKGQTPQGYGGFNGFWEAKNKQARTYRKERWKVGYQFLMDLYHNEKFGPIVNKHTRLWSDQMARYQKEILDNYYSDVEEHYSLCSGNVQRPQWEPEYYDYVSHLSGGGYYEVIQEYLSDWAEVLHDNQKYDCCCTSPCDSPDGCCETCVLVYDATPTGHHANDAIRTSVCPEEVPAGWAYSYHPQTVPHPLIWNSGRPAVSESVYIDADTDGNGGYKNVFDIDTMEGENFPILANGQTSGRALAGPNVWFNDEMISFSAGGVYGPSTYFSGQTPVFGTFYEPLAGNNGFKVKELGGQLPQISQVGNLPMHQNRIQVYLDIYEAYVHAVDANTHAQEENKKLQESLNDLLNDLAVNYDNKLYEVTGGQPHYKTRSGNLSSASSMDKLYNESLERANVFYDDARRLAREVTKAIIQSEKEAEKADSWADAYEKWKGKDKITLPELLTLEGKGPTVTGGDSPKDVFLQRLARVYQTILYFGGGEDIAGASVTYKPDISRVNRGLSGSYDQGSFGESRYKIERLKVDNSFKTPKKEENYGWTGDTTRTVNAQFKGKEFPEPEEEHMHIGLWAELSNKIRGKPIGTLEEGDITEILEDIDIARQERLEEFHKLNEVRGEWATRYPKSLSGNDGGTDHIFTKFNFNSSTCLLNKRSSTSR